MKNISSSKCPAPSNSELKSFGLGVFCTLSAESILKFPVAVVSVVFKAGKFSSQILLLLRVPRLSALSNCHVLICI